MQNKPQPSRRSVWPVFAALLLIVIAGLAVWRFWPREYSPADPRRYVALEDIPLDRSIFDNVELYHDFLATYGIQEATADDEIRQRQRAWTLDFLQRVNDDKDAVVHWLEGDPLYTFEIRYNARTNEFIVTIDHRTRNDNYQKYGVVSDRFPFLKYHSDWSWLFLSVDPADSLTFGPATSIVSILVDFSGTHDDFDILLAALEEKRLLVKEEKQ